MGVARHRRMVREWFYDDVRTLDHDARWWSEMEFHASGVPHEHGMLTLSENAPDLTMRTRWFERAGYAKWLRVDARGAIAPAAYVSKYAQKATSREPLVYGFGLNQKPSFSMVLR